VHPHRIRSGSVVRGSSRAPHEAEEVSKRIYVGNLPFSTTDEELEELFARHGAVESAKVITDRETGRSRGFGFVEMGNEDADKAIQALDGQDLGGRPLRVNEARERTRGGGGGGDRRGPRRDGPPRGRY
jgi:RNA recognition motif-containing protein